MMRQLLIIAVIMLEMGITLSRATTEDSAELLRRSREAMRDQLWSVALRWLEQAWSNAPSDVLRFESALGLADVRFELNDAHAEARLDDEIPPADRNHPAVWLRRAILRRRAGDETGAHAALERVHWDQLPVLDRARAALWYSDVLWGRGDMDEALATLEFAVSALEPSWSVMVARRLASRWRELRVPSRAVELLEPAMVTASPPDEWVIRLDLASAYFEVGRAEDAAEVVRPVLENFAVPRPLRASAWLLRARAEAAAGRTSSAEMAFEQARQFAEGSGAETDILFEMATHRLKSDQLESARDLIRQGLGRHPRHRRGLELQLELAKRWQAAAQPAAALEAYQAYLDHSDDPAGQAEAQAGKGRSLLALSRPLEAAAAFERAAAGLREPAARMEAELNRAEALARANRWTEAYAVCEGFTRAHPQHPATERAALLAAECLIRLDRDDEALRSLEALVTGSQAPAAHLRRARVYERRGDWTEAARAYAKVLEQDPETPEARWARLGLALLHYRRADGEAAIRVLRPLLHSWVDDEVSGRATVLLVWCYYLVGDDSAAIATARELLERSPRSPVAVDLRLWLADLEWNRSRFEKAEQEYIQAAEAAAGAAPADVALYRAGRAAAAAGNLTRALRHFQRLAEEYPSSPIVPEARFAQGDVLTEIGRFDAAVLSFDEVIRAVPDSSLAMLAWGRKGDCHFTLGAQMPPRYEQALSAYLVVADREREAVDIRLQALYKAGRCDEMLGRPAAAIDRYLTVVYRHLEERAAGRPGAPLWFARAAFAAAGLQERANQWQDAVQIYRRVVEDGGPAASDAAAQVRRLLGQHPDTQ